MSVPIARFPITCPVCKKERLGEFRMADVSAALLGSRPIRLSAVCHNQNWNATEVELEQIREYLSAGYSAPCANTD